MKDTKTPPPLVWVDLEMTGLDAQSDTILELACTITDHQLHPIAHLETIAIHQPEEVLQTMNSWCTLHHTQSGLLDRVRTSSITIAQAEEHVLNFLKQHCPQGQSPLCGNSVWMDKLFLITHMPRVVQYLHYRIIDVSGIKLLIHYWYGYNQEHPAFAKKKVHRAADDIAESIEELAFYHKTFFKPPHDV